jgi:DNA repair protein RecO (recombination protein O)
MIETSTGLILRTRPLTETSLIVEWLTADLGRLATVAKGARRSKSPFAGKLDLFYLAEFSFQRSRRSDLHQLREVALKETHEAPRRDIEALEQASYCVALVEQATEKEAPVAGIFALMNGLLEELGRHPPRTQTVLAFELKLLGELGLQPDLDKEKLKPDVREILRTLQRSDWTTVAKMKSTAGQFAGVERFLRGFLEFHLERVPRMRARVMQEQKEK